MSSPMGGSGIRWATTGDIELAFETFGSRDDPPVLLIMGLAMQMLLTTKNIITGITGAEAEVRRVAEVVGAVDEPEVVDALDQGLEAEEQLATGERGPQAEVGARA